jgi:uncharacterized protein (TIGR03000 family)
MFSRRSGTASVMLLAMMGLLLMAGWGHAQPAGPQGTGWISGGSQVSPSGSYGGSSYAPPSYYTPPTYYAPPAAAPSTPAATGYQSFYPSEAGAFGSASGAARNRPVSVNVTVPADAQIWFGDVKTDRTGTFRQFVSPPVAPGREYTYDVKATWTQNGKEVTQTRNVTVHAGDVINLSFRSRSDE